jgi:hypothetical protein
VHTLNRLRMTDTGKAMLGNESAAGKQNVTASCFSANLIDKVPGTGTGTSYTNARTMSLNISKGPLL